MLTEDKQSACNKLNQMKWIENETIDKPLGMLISSVVGFVIIHNRMRERNEWIDKKCQLKSRKMCYFIVPVNVLQIDCERYFTGYDTEFNEIHLSYYLSTPWS